MTKTIVVPLDGSGLAERALPTAAWLARGLHAPVHLVRTTFAPAVAAEIDPDEAYLRIQADTMGGVDVVVDVVRQHFPGAGIIRAVDAVADPTLCLSTRGKGGLAEILLGSVSDEVLRNVAVPAVLVGPHCLVREPPSRTLVVSVDGSDGSSTILPVAADWTQRLGLDVQVVAAAECGPSGLPDPRAIAAHEVVDDAVAQLAELGVEAQGHVINGTHQAEVVVAFASGLPAALIAIGTHGRSGWSAAALGRVATDIVRHAHCPVLLRRVAE